MTNWFIVATNPNCEAKAVAEIRRAGFRAYLPKLARIRRHHRTNEPLVKRRPLMTGYVFMRFNKAANWYALRKCQGVKGVLYVDGQPYQMPRADIAAIMRAQRSMLHEDMETRSVRREMREGEAKSVRTASKTIARRKFSSGMHVTAPMGAAERMLARILSVTKKGTIKAVVLMEGRETPVEFTDLDTLEVVDMESKAA